MPYYVLRNFPRKAPIVVLFLIIKNWSSLSYQIIGYGLNKNFTQCKWVYSHFINVWYNFFCLFLSWLKILPITSCWSISILQIFLVCFFFPDLLQKSLFVFFFFVLMRSGNILKKKVMITWINMIKAKKKIRVIKSASLSLLSLLAKIKCKSPSLILLGRWLHNP